MSQTRSVDDLLIKVQHEQSGTDNAQPPIAAVPDPEPEVKEPEVAEPEGEEVPEGHDAPVPEAKEENAKADEPAADPVDDSPIDQYGNPVAKPKTYTEEEVNQKLNEALRDRFSRSRHTEQQQTQQQVQKAAETFESDPNSEDPWQVQLKNFIKQTNVEIENEQREAQWRAQQAQKQAEFESKFTIGMAKYKDFHQVTSGKPITDAIMRASMNLEDPAAFLYAISKVHPQEIDRMSRMDDPLQVAAEVGRVDERMRKESRAVSAAPKPVQAVKGDMPVKQHEQPSLEQRIAQYAKQKFARR